MADDFDPQIFERVEFFVQNVGKVFVPIEKTITAQLRKHDMNKFYGYVVQRWKLWEANRHIRAAEWARLHPYNPATDIFNQPVPDDEDIQLDPVAQNSQPPQLRQIVNNPPRSAVVSRPTRIVQSDHAQVLQHSLSENQVGRSLAASSSAGGDDDGFAPEIKASLSDATPVVATSSSSSTSANLKWTPQATQCLVTIRLGMEDDFLQPTVKKNVLWDRIASEMQKKNHHVSGKAAHEKFRNMMWTYRTAKARQSKTGESSKVVNWDYFKAFDEIYATRAKVVVPNEQLGSTIPNDEEPNDGRDDNPVDVDNLANKKPIRGLSISAYRKRKADIALDRLELEQERLRRRIEVEEQRTAALERTENKKIEVLNNLLQAFLNKAGPSNTS